MRYLGWKVKKSIVGVIFSFIVVMILSLVAESYPETKELRSGRLANLKNFSSTDISIVEPDVIPMKISVPYFILAIPEKNRNISHPLSFDISLTNNTSNVIWAGVETVKPELVGQHGQALKLHTQRKPDSSRDRGKICQLVKPTEGAIFTPGGLSWQNDKLQLYGGDLSDSWYFDNIKPQNYQIRFTYYSSGDEISCYDVKTRTFTTVEGLGTVRGATPFIPLRIVEPVFIDSYTVEVDGVHFEIQPPDPVVTIPSKETGAIIPIEIGVTITNKTATALRFRQANNRLQMLGENKQIIPDKSIATGESYSRVYNCLLAEPGESVAFNFLGALYWQDNSLRLSVSDGSGGFRYFNDLKPGKYYIGFGYYPWTSDWFCNTASRSAFFLEDIWKGVAATPFVEFRLVQP